MTPAIEPTLASSIVRSVYVRDPADISLELAAWTKVLDESDGLHAPASAEPAPA